MNRDKKKDLQLKRRHLRVRRRVSGTAERPRLAVFRSLTHISCQVIDDEVGKTLVSASTQEKELRKKLPRTGNIDAARQVGRSLGEKLKTIGIKRLAFDRGGNRFHGRVKALADAVRESGVKF